MEQPTEQFYTEKIEKAAQLKDDAKEYIN